MQFDEDKTIEEILALIPSEEKKEEPETEALPDFIKEEKEKKEEKADDKLKPESLNILTNKEIPNVNLFLSFENLMTNYETQKKEKKTLILRLFLNSVIDMFNCVINSYDTNGKFFEKLSYLNIETLLEKMPLYIIRLQKLMELIILACPENKEKIYSVIEEERIIKKTAFETLINFSFEELYDYFINDCKLIIYGFHFYNMERAFKTLKDIIRESNGAITKKETGDFKQLEKLDDMEIETINLENSVFE
jgi:hypothetical protein